MRAESIKFAGLIQQGLAPIYLIAGDEPLLVEECCALVREKAVIAGYERSVFTVETGFDWNGFFAEVYAPSLFAPRSLFELRLATGKPGETGAQILVQLAQRLPTHVLLLVTTPRLDKAAQQSKWVQALEQTGVLLNIWPLEAAKLPEWINRRLQAKGVHAESGLAQLLAQYMEGNLLAIAQEIDKLALMYGSEQIKLADVADIFSDNSQFSIYSWVDACLLGEIGPTLRILLRLRSEGTEPILVLWAVTREIRTLAQIALQLGAGKPEFSAFQTHRVWPQRQLLVRTALRRVPAGLWLTLMRQAAHADKVLKGRATGTAGGDIWVELELLGLALCQGRTYKQLLKNG